MEKPIRVGYDAFDSAHEQARQQVATPALGLVLIGVFGAVTGLVQALGVTTTFVVIASDKGLPHAHEALQVYSVFGGGALAGLLAIAGYTLIVFGGLSMKSLRRRNLALVASVLAIVPCCSPCYLLALPIGIWSLIVLSSSDVKNAFR